MVEKSSILKTEHGATTLELETTTTLTLSTTRLHLECIRQLLSVQTEYTAQRYRIMKTNNTEFIPNRMEERSQIHYCEQGVEKEEDRPSRAAVSPCIRLESGRRRLAFQ